MTFDDRTTTHQYDTCHEGSKPVCIPSMTQAKRSVLFLIPTLNGGGAERVIVTLLKSIDRSRFRLTLGVVDMRKAAFRNDLPADVECIELGATRVRYALSRIVALIWKRRPDVVFSTLGHLNLVLSIIRPLLPGGVRYIARETGVVSKTLQTYSYSGVWKILYRWFYRRFDMLVCQSHFMQADLVERFGFPAKRSVIINNPVDVEQISKMATAPLDYSGFPAGGIRLVAAGRLSTEKGFDLLIEAMAVLGNPTLYLYILGEGSLLNELRQLAIARGVADNIEFVGFQSNPYAWLAQADAFVLSSRHEGFPNVVLEALACGTPVIATPALGGVREILDGVTGCVVAGEISAAALASAVSEWLDDPRSRIPALAVAPYRLKQIVRQYEAILTT